LGELAAHAVGVGAVDIDLVDRDHHGHAGSLGVVDRLDGLRHDAVVGSDHDHRDVGDLRAAGAHGREGLVAGRVEEGDRVAVVVDLVGADVLRDAARLARRDLCLPNGIQQRGLAVVDVPHDRDDGRALDQILVGVLVGRLLLLVGLRGADKLDPLVEGAGEHLDGLVGKGLGEGCHLAQLHQLLDDLRRAQLERLGHLLHGRAGAHLGRRLLLLLGLQPRLRLGLEIGLDPLGPAPASAPAARRLGLLGRRGALAPGGLRVDDDAAPATAAATTGAATFAATAAAGTRSARALTAGSAGTLARAVIGPGGSRTAVAARPVRPVCARAAGAAAALGAALLRRGSVLKNSRTPALGACAPNRLTLGRLNVGTRGRRSALSLRPTWSLTALTIALSRRLRGGLLGRGLSRGAALGSGRPTVRGIGGRSRIRLRSGSLRPPLRLRGRLAGLRVRLRGRGLRAGSVAERSCGLLLLDARGGDLHVEAGFAQDLEGLLAGDAPFLRYLVDALLCHSQTKSMVSCFTDTDARNARSSGRPPTRLAAHSGWMHT
jgi:hypothetical protein